MFSFGLGAMALAAGALRAEEVKEDLPSKATLRTFEPKAPLRWSFLLPTGRTPAEEPAYLSARPVAGRSLVFADLDGNGRWDDVGIDGWTVEGGGYLVPFEGRIVVGAFQVELRFPKEGTELRYRATAVPGEPAALEALRLINDLRLANGLVPVMLDPELSRACELHSRYCAENGISHDEDPSKPGYSEEGARAGAASSVASCASPKDAAAAIYAQVFHRFTIVDPLTARIGIGSSGSITSIDGHSGQVSRRWRWPSVIPAPGVTGQPRDFDDRESPRAYPRDMQPGFPVTLQFKGASPVDVTAELRRGSANGRELPLLLSWPEKPASTYIPDNFGSIFLVPTARLDPFTTYAYRITFKRGGKDEVVTGEFTTGKSASALR